MRRCSQCGRLFVPNPRVASRQMTCGGAECKRRQHAESCRRWREKNRDVTSCHYVDFVVPFRKRHQTYQCEWRILRSLREIRDAIEPVLRTVDGPLGRLISRSGRVLATRCQEHRRASLHGRDWFVDVLAIAKRIFLLVRKLISLVRRLDEARGRLAHSRYETQWPSKGHRST